jgi:hypothetical protein
MVMRVWANRLGPILANKIGHHQHGFIPGRDGRENIINVQMIIDLLNAKNEERAVAFLDQEKTFDMVSFTTINTIFTKLNWPERFKSLLATVYKENHIRAKVCTNGTTSANDFAVNSGTRQGCPLSPLNPKKETPSGQAEPRSLTQATVTKTKSLQTGTD